ncbi:sodium:solute symporter family protein [Bacillus thermotolerans]|uniref:sodium:solute symporter family protein n=1 Tax=Bacillus thermotolerans TaxID=1221996 RepID=UPI0005892487|nr:sodium:solute symporter family protein [Bacillus thermotolerans]KKB44372.1 Sodium/proline symporter [Bacillus thermotolerans]
MNFTILIPMILVYTGIMSALAYYGYKTTRTEADYLVGGRQIHPTVMALSYGATFISTSSLIGFGGVSASHGFGLLWLCFLNIVFGVFLSFVFFGTRIRKLSNQLGAYTFAELLGKRFQSKFITVFAGLVIFILMPAYTSIVLVGGGRFLQETLSMNYNVALLVLAIIVGLYVLSGGIKAVMYTDAFAAIVMFIGMSLFLFMGYKAVGGIIDGHAGLTALKGLVPPELAEQGHRGWTSMPELGSPLWWSLVSTIIMGVGIGVLAQPQLIMRFMTVKNNQALYRSVVVGGVFIFFMTGAAFMLGPISNLYFYEREGMLAMEVAQGNVDLVIPAFINHLMPDWFVYLFTLTLLSAAISTISSLIHLQGSAFGQDILKTLGVKSLFGMDASRIGVLIGILAAVALSYILPGGVIAQATAFWFGICAAGFLPVLLGTLFWKRSTRAGAKASMLVGFGISIFGFLFLHQKEAAAFGLSELIFNRETLFGYPMTHIDPLFYALPLSAITFVAVSLLTKKEEFEAEAPDQEKRDDKIG